MCIHVHVNNLEKPHKTKKPVILTLLKKVLRSFFLFLGSFLVNGHIIKSKK